MAADPGQSGARHDDGGVQLAFVTTTADSLRQIRLWIQYHRAVGVTDFILFVEGQAAKPEVSNALDKIEGVKVRLPPGPFTQERCEAVHRSGHLHISRMYQLIADTCS